MRLPNSSRRFLAASLASAAVFTAGCSASSPKPTSTTSAGALPECAWGQSAIQAPHRAIAVTNNDAVYELVDTISGRVLGVCPTSGSQGVASYLAAYQPLTFEGRPTPDSTFNPLWFGGFRPGGPDGTLVVTPSGTVDLATGQRAEIDVSGFRSAAVGRSQLVMVRADSGSSSAPSTQSSDWCVLQLSADTADPGACEPVPDAAGPGTPVVTASGAVAWSPVELTATSIRADADDPPLYLRRGSGLVTATGYVLDGYPNGYDGGRVAASGRAFVVIPSVQGAADLAAIDPVVWYTVGDDAVLTEHRAEVSYRDVGRLVDGDPRTMLVDDTNVTDGGRTLVLTVNHNASPVLVAVPEQGKPRVVLDVASTRGAVGARERSLGINEHFLTPLDVATP